MSKAHNEDAQSQQVIEAQIEILITQMTLEEKAGQLTQFSDPGELTGVTQGREHERHRREFIQSGIVGSALNVLGADNVRSYQEIAVEKSRLGIPMMFAYDVIHGYETMFPIPLAEAASWDLELIEKSARIAAIEASAEGVNWTFAPMVDISRDARWGRVMEGAGEDPFLGSEIAVARVKGFQGENLSACDTIAATLKHFAGYGFSESGKDYNAVDIGIVTLYNSILPPFHAAIKRANAQSVMNAFNTLNGVPATGDKFLQRDLLKKKWGFDGVVVSDWGSGREMIAHGFAADRPDAARLSMIGGSDIDMESFIYMPFLPKLVRAGVIEEAIIDESVRRVLRLKHALGLFENPYRYLDRMGKEKQSRKAQHVAASRAMAEASIVLLKNNNKTLPLKKGERIALIGALADDKDSPLGNWRAQAARSSAVSLYEAFKAKGINFDFAQGAPVIIGQPDFVTEVAMNTVDRNGFEEATRLATQADKVVMVLGENAYQSGEGRSRADIGLPGLQQDLLEAVYAANPNIILVVMSGRPLTLTWADEHIPAVIAAWHLGHESGHAIANVMTGETNPNGKLPMSFPRSEGQIPIYYNHLNTGRPGPLREVFWSHYTDETNVPLYPFGHGLSYTEFTYSNLVAQTGAKAIEVSVNVKNSGDRDGKEIVQLYIRDQVASISRPVRELKGFEKISLRAGEEVNISFILTEKELGFYNGCGDFIVEPGKFDVFIGGSSDTTFGTEFYFQPI